MSTTIDSRSDVTLHDNSNEVMAYRMKITDCKEQITTNSDGLTQSAAYIS